MSNTPDNDNPYAAPRGVDRPPLATSRWEIAPAWRWYIWSHVILAALPYFALATEGTRFGYFAVFWLITFVSIPILVVVVLILSVRHPIQSLLMTSAVLLVVMALFIVQIGGMLPAVQ